MISNECKVNESDKYIYYNFEDNIYIIICLYVDTLLDDSKAINCCIVSIIGGSISSKFKKHTTTSKEVYEMIELTTTSKEVSWLRCLLANISL